MRLNASIVIFLVASTWAIHGSGATNIQEIHSESLQAHFLNISYHGKSIDEQVFILHIEGLMNRKVPSLFVNSGSDLHWMQYLAQKKGYEWTVTPNVCDVLNTDAAREAIEGLILYNSQEDATRYVAMTMGALQNLVPVTQEILNSPTYSCVQQWSVKEDLRGRWNGNDTAAYSWALQNLMPQCNKSLAYNVGHSHNGTFLGNDPSIVIGVDYAVRAKAFIMNLSPAAVPFAWAPNITYPGYPEQAAMFDAVLQALDPLAGVFGWAEPEPLFAERTTKNGKFIMCDAAPNLSFWAGVQVTGSVVLPYHADPQRKLDRSKYYVTFMTNEGDTPKIVASLMAGQWLDPLRGQVPVSWGINTFIASFLPAIIEYYVATSTSNDTFFAGCSGAGYGYPFEMPNFPAYASHVGQSLAAYGPDSVDVWNPGVNLTAFAEYARLARAEQAKLRLFTSEPVPVFGPNNTVLQAMNYFLDDGTPVIYSDGSLFYYSLNATNPTGDLVSKIKRVMSMNPEPPFFINVYGGLGFQPHYISLILATQRLLGDQVEFVGMQDYALLALQAAKFTTRVLSREQVGDRVTLRITISLRNPDGASGNAGTVSWQLPPGWTSSEPLWAHEAIDHSKALHRQVTFTGRADSSAAIVILDDRHSSHSQRVKCIL